MAMIRIPRDCYGQARATLNFVTVLKGQRVVLRVGSVHGCTRTAKIAAIREIQRTYRPKICAASSKKETEQLCLELEELLSSLQQIE
jgi:hypothetical protein